MVVGLEENGAGVGSSKNKDYTYPKRQEETAMAYVHQSSLREQLKLDGPKDIHKMSQRKRRSQESVKEILRKCLEEEATYISQESGAKDNDVHHTSVKDFHGNDVHIGNSSSCSEEHTNLGWREWIPSYTIVEWRDWSPYDTNVGWRDWSPSYTNVELRDWGQSLEVGELVEEPVVTTMNMSFPNFQTHDLILLLVPTSIDVVPCLNGSISASAQEKVEEFVVVDNFKVPKEYEILYKKIYGKYGHIATKQVIKSSDTVLEVCVSDLLRVISAMETKRGVELTEELLKEWEGIIKDAEALKFNVKWFREGFDRVKSQWMSDDDEQVLDAVQVEYVGLCTRKDELETDLSEVKIQMKKAAAKISSKREAIRENQTQKLIFQNEPVLSIVLNS